MDDDREITLRDEWGRWRATHRIEHAGALVAVMLVQELLGTASGAAYDEEDWNNCAPTDYERDEDGNWLFQGEAFTGTVTRISERGPMIKSQEITKAVAEFLVSTGEVDKETYAEQMGAGLCCVLIPWTEKTSWVFGTANELWGGDLVNKDGDRDDSVETNVRSDSQNVKAIAYSILVKLNEYAAAHPER
jgi:hypothetical protein|tara:strand:- start:835 stop:1404 length:570 start_codon:yes stop_codon:yes gene_type:complete